jgi:uncharacterized protein
MAALASFESAADNAGGSVPHQGRLPEVARITAPGRGVVCSHCIVADRTVARMRGLLGRSGLDEGEGMLITPAPSVMTFFMRFPIDVVFLDKEQRIVKIAHSLVPWRTAGARKAVASLELPAGTAAAHRLEVGDVLTIEPAQADHVQ